jgi:hypothetical protein
MRALLRCEHEWVLPAFDDSRLLNLNKKRREADVPRCVRPLPARRVRFRAATRNAEIDRFLWHAREPFDDAQLTTLSNPLRAEQLGGRQRHRQRRRARSRSRPLATCRRKDARAGSVSSRLGTVFRRTASKPATPTPSSPAAVATAADGSPSVPRHAAVVDNLKSQGRSRLASMPVRPQFNVIELAAAGKQADRAAAAQGARSQERC